MKKQRALFLDRDGIINVDYGYVSKIEDFQFMEGIFELLHLFIDEGYLLFVVTNQSGIGRGYYTQTDFDTLTEWMIDSFEKKQIPIQKVAYCPHAPKDNCHCRKPKTGMVDDILKQYPIDLTHSWLIGDKQSDIDLAHNCKIENSIAIGNQQIKNSTYHFDTIIKCMHFFKNNPNRLNEH
jgi:D-glycero-D-manno-heptose 1,7-bisphosphate phosphatase